MNGKTFTNAINHTHSVHTKQRGRGVCCSSQKATYFTSATHNQNYNAHSAHQDAQIFIWHIANSKELMIDIQNLSFEYGHKAVYDDFSLRIKDAGMKDWRLDFAYPLRKLAIEVEGGTWTGGRHTRGQGFEDDTFKYNALTLMGWRLLRFTGTSIKSGVALQTIEAALRMDWAEPWVITA